MAHLPRRRLSEGEVELFVPQVTRVYHADAVEWSEKSPMPMVMILGSPNQARMENKVACHLRAMYSPNLSIVRVLSGGLLQIDDEWGTTQTLTLTRNDDGAFKVLPSIPLPIGTCRPQNLTLARHVISTIASLEFSGTLHTYSPPLIQDSFHVGADARARRRLYDVTILFCSPTSSVLPLRPYIFRQLGFAPGRACR